MLASILIFLLRHICSRISQITSHPWQSNANESSVCSSLSLWGPVNDDTSCLVNVYCRFCFVFNSTFVASKLSWSVAKGSDKRWEGSGKLLKAKWHAIYSRRLLDCVQWKPARYGWIMWFTLGSLSHTLNVSGVSTCCCKLESEERWSGNEKGFSRGLNDAAIRALVSLFLNGLSGASWRHFFDTLKNSDLSSYLLRGAFFSFSTSKFRCGNQSKWVACGQSTEMWPEDSTSKPFLNTASVKTPASLLVTLFEPWLHFWKFSDRQHPEKKEKASLPR